MTKTKTDLTGLAWRTSSSSANGGGPCVEVADLRDAVAVRDSQNPPAGHFALPSAERAAFLSAARCGTFSKRPSPRCGFVGAVAAGLVSALGGAVPGRLRWPS